MQLNKIQKTVYLGVGASALAVTLALAPGAEAVSVLYMGGTCACWNPSTGGETIANGYLATRGDVAPMPYWAGLAFPVTIPKGAARALGVIDSTEGPVVLTGVSQGALAIHDAELRIMSRPESQRPKKEDLSFVVIADEANPFNGILTKNPILQILVPVSDIDTPYDTISIAREYDGYADWPDRPNPLAVANAAMGIVYLHPDYEDVDINDPGTTIQEVVNSQGGKTTHYVVPTKDLPLTRPLRDIEKFATGKTTITDGVDAVIRPAIDAGYKRNDDKPTSARNITKTTVTTLKADAKKVRTHLKAEGKKHRQETRAAVKDAVKKVEKAAKKAFGKKDQ